MTIWPDAQLSPVPANWLRATFGVRCFPVRDLGDIRMHDETLFLRAKQEADVIVTKDVDPVHVLRRFGPFLKIFWIRMGNTSNKRMKDVFSRRWPDIVALAEAGEPLIEIAE